MATALRKAPQRARIPNIRPLLRVVEETVVEVAAAMAAEFMEDEAESFKERILEQRFRSFVAIYYPKSGTNLSPRWLRRKELAGADSRTMVATGHYVRRIRVFSRKHLRGREWRIGFGAQDQARNLEGKPIPLALDLLAKTHEFGSVKASIPARPHWRPYAKHTFAPRAAKLRKLVWGRTAPKIRARTRGRMVVHG